MELVWVRLLGATRAGNCADGHPMWVLHTSEGDFRTQPGARVGYEVDNHAREDAADSWVGKRVVLTVTAPGREVASWKRGDFFKGKFVEFTLPDTGRRQVGVITTDMIDGKFYVKPHGRNLGRTYPVGLDDLTVAPRE